jgi:hypothetical protein
MNGVDGTGVAGRLSNDSYSNNSPDEQAVTVVFEAPVDVCDNYGTRMQAWFMAADSGRDTFRISGDENAHLWFSASQADAVASAETASVPGWTSKPPAG